LDVNGALLAFAISSVELRDRVAMGAPRLGRPRRRALKPHLRPLG